MQETSPVNVQVCHNKAGKICDDDLKRNGERSGRQLDPSTCVEVYETSNAFGKGTNKYRLSNVHALCVTVG